MFSILILYLASPSVPTILDIIIPLNESRDRIYLYQTEYFVDQDEYYIPILIHAYMTVPISVSVLVFLDNMFAMYIHHACGMFAILGSHLEVLHMSNNNENLLDKAIRSRRIHSEIVRCANIHCNAIDFANELESSYAVAYLLMFSVNLSMITVTGIVTVMKLNQPSEMVKFLAFTVGEIFHVFFSCFQGQELIQQSGNIFEAAYNSEWYKIPVRDRNLLIPIMVRSMKPCAVTAGKLYPISMGTFSVVLKNAMSFFTVLSSMR
uniref:Olfactory receptor 20 n=1 Tax=Meteorus pulchricornis TaxID=51522 RepID=A0A1S5VFL4_9HYME|nr:olfactory receptor 20 [Meteorus pulchricornis]